MRNIEDYPLIMTAKEIADVLGCSKRTAYSIMDTPGFPKVQLRKMKWVSRQAFFKWIDGLGNKT